MSSPAERYAAAKVRNRLAKTHLGQFLSQMTFELDQFQLEACQELEKGLGVLVAAPTGAGKTVVGEFAIHLAQAQGTKAFYTTPIKALSNQKYTDLVARYGEGKVGLLTGDTSINSEAEIVVMTTEVLRNMLYAQSSTLTNLGYVVMDEVHYLADRFRGAVWEEVIIHLPEHVQLVSLSATVSNAEEFGAWLDTVRGTTSVVVSEHRPVPLWQYMMVGNRLIDLFVYADDGATSINPELTKAVQSRQQSYSYSSSTSRSSHARYRNSGTKKRRTRERQTGGKDGLKARRPQDRRSRGQRPNRPAVIRTLDRAGLLPAIYFIFSRAACDDAVQECVRSGINLTSDTESHVIGARIDQIAKSLRPEDLEVLGFWDFRKAAMQGICAHHAGLLPIFKEAIEELFAGGLLKLVFATETLALGINMPARTVVIEKLQKFNGITHVDLTAGEYTQLTGRAGRRGIDIEGHAVVLYREDTSPKNVAGLASKRTYPLNSSFAPTYNMSINLLAQYGAERARGILESSFAQFQADQAVVGMAQKLRQQEKSLSGYAEAFECDRGDFREYARMRMELSELEKTMAKSRSKDRFHSIADSLTNLEVGDVFSVAGKRKLGIVVVLSRANSQTDPRVAVLTEQAQVRNVGAHDLKEPIELLSRIKIKKDFNSNSPKQRRTLANLVQEALFEGIPPRKQRASEHFSYQPSQERERIHQLKMQLADHPCHDCPKREDHARWANRWAKLDTETEVLRQQIRGRTGTIAKRFDQYVALLTDYGYLLTDTGGSSADLVTNRGQLLRKIYGEKDMLTAELINHGSLKHLNPRELAAFVSILVYEAKKEAMGYHYSMPTEAIKESVDDAMAIWDQLRTAERHHKLPQTSQPDISLVWPVYKWAGGKSLRECLRGTELSAGDFVRWIRQCIDVLEQISKATGQQEIRDHCHAAIDYIRHGVVDYVAADILFEDKDEDDNDDE